MQKRNGQRIIPQGYRREKRPAKENKTLTNVKKATLGLLAGKWTIFDFTAIIMARRQHRSPMSLTLDNMQIVFCFKLVQFKTNWPIFIIVSMELLYFEF